MKRRLIVLVGLPGSGKSTVGAALAARTSLRCFDSDREVERAAAMPISRIFEQYGEPAFRMLEREIAAQLLNAKSGIVALGGGALEHPRTLSEMKRNSTSLWLNPPLEAILKRLENDDERPLLRGADKLRILEQMAERRRGSYSRADFRIQSISLDSILREIEKHLGSL